MSYGAGIRQRLKALFIDWLCMSAYLILLALIFTTFYRAAWGGIPAFSEMQTQIIAFATTVLPITLFSIFQESRAGKWASFGKKKIHLIVTYKGNALRGSIIRNVFKFLPWQLGHISVIRGISNNFSTWDVWLLYVLAIVLPVVYILMVAFRKDHRHIPDLLAGSCVVRKIEPGE